MKTVRILSTLAAVVLSANVALAQTGDGVERKDYQLLKDVASTVERYTQFTIFDDVSAGVKDGVVTLTGKVTMPYKRNDIERRVSMINGVRMVRDEITVLPVSQFDDELRY
jgi:osmotically-inducible protein OsmY